MITIGGRFFKFAEVLKNQVSSSPLLEKERGRVRRSSSER
jgi:hypothetical protein